ncbi:peroxide stress-activated histidine kinase mak2 [Rhizophagus irregularis DAOM 181602=DAOM 197198]|uniref:Signal transduction histidine kinase dimerisation/phosphoacceptor domain-containing protein n=2 Tax=Rhizophagus irregularis TaxID=588596 RepID=A0A015M258_RHIIW|nr:hypothetical protein RirG_175580 [Rhizophagus irregularis DAOM 197198w]GET57244.1 peroxide stress-activated histidine kinase mak2 [Rhizophagus irregularis DAOM 181602=DAOM 197198]
MLFFLNRYDNDSQKQFEDEERVYLSNFGVNVVKRRVIVADGAKGAFISISHELRNPLYGILASCELMEESKLNEAQAGLVETIQGCGTSLISIINSVLDFAKL